MKHTFFENNLNMLLVQRNFLVIFSLLLIIALILSSSFLFLKKERVIVVPTVIEKEFWVDSKSVSATYLEQIGIFIGQLLLSKSAYSADIQKTILCRHTQPEFLNTLKQKLLEEEETLKKQNISYVFFLNNVLVSPDLLTVMLEGDRQFFVGGQKTSSEKCYYRLHFSYNGSRLLLKGISQEKQAQLL